MHQPFCASAYGVTNKGLVYSGQIQIVEHGVKGGFNVVNGIDQSSIQIKHNGLNS